MARKCFEFFIRYANINKTKLIPFYIKMKLLNKEIINFIEKYPFFTDPIVLFKTDNEISKDIFINWKLEVNYPKIKDASRNIQNIELKLNNIYNILEKTDIINNNNNNNIESKNQYKERLNDFLKIIKIIKIFNNENEQEKFNLINEYFWVDIEKISVILGNKNYLLSYFSSENPILNKKEIEKHKNTFIFSKEIKKYFIEALKYLNLEKNWKVKIGDSTSIIHTNFNELWWEIIIPENKKINIKKLLELIIHEIDWHCVQFSNAKWLYSWSIRFSNSEVLLEWYAMFLEYSLTLKYFWENRIVKLINKKELHYNYLNNKISLEKLLENYTWNIFRLFRWFKNINKYSNLKDMVYLQWIYEVMQNLEKYWNFLDLIKKWTVNQYYIEKHWILLEKKEKFSLENSRAIYILNKYFKI